MRTALRDTAIQARVVVNVTARLIAFCLLIAAPFLVIAGIVYAWLLTEFDINFYLQEKPPAFIAAVAIGCALGSVFATILVWFVSGWILALPLAIFEEVAPRTVLRESHAQNQRPAPNHDWMARRLVYHYHDRGNDRIGNRWLHRQLAGNSHHGFAMAADSRCWIRTAAAHRG